MFSFFFNMKNSDIYWRRYKIQETLYIGQWCLSLLQSRHLGTSHSSPNHHHLPHHIFLNLINDLNAHFLLIQLFLFYYNRDFDFLKESHHGICRAYHMPDMEHMFTNICQKNALTSYGSLKTDTRECCKVGCFVLFEVEPQQHGEILEEPGITQYNVHLK